MVNDDSKTKNDTAILGVIAVGVLGILGFLTFIQMTDQSRLHKPEYFPEPQKSFIK